MGKLISDKFKEWKKECEDRFNTLKANEEELNRIFIDYNKLRHKGILMRKNMVEDQYLKMKKNTNLNAFYSQESILHEYGYNVSEQDNLTDDERERILAMLVDMKVVSRESIKYFLNNLIFRFGRQNKDNSGAIEKWERDINFICNYKIDSLTKYGIRSLRK